MRTVVKYIFLSFIVTTIVSCGGSGGGKDSNTSPGSSSQISSSSAATITHFRKITGDKQSQTPGQAVAVAPVIDVLDSNEVPVAGVSVTFAVTLGDGSIQNTTTVTDATGRASSGTWTLGSSVGVNKITASINGFEPLTFLAKAVHSSADLTIGVGKYKGSFGDDTVISSTYYLHVFIRSTYLIEEATLNLNGTSCNLKFAPTPPNYPPYWYCPFELLTNVPSGPFTLIASTKDAMGNIANEITIAIADRPPILSLQPLNGSVLHSTSVNIKVICTDELPSTCAQTDATISYSGGKNINLQGVSSIDQLVDLSAASGPVTLTVSGRDQGGLYGTHAHTFYVEPSPRVSTLQYLNNAVIWDASDSRILFLDTAITPNALKILDIASNTTTTIDTHDSLGKELIMSWRTYGFLTPGGAMYQRRVPPPLGDNKVHIHLHEWDGTTLNDLDSMDSSTGPIRTNGKWAIYQTKANAWWLRNTETQQSTLITETGVVYGVATNGDVVYRDSGSNGNLYRFRNNTSQVLASNTNSVGGQIDETRVAYVKTNGSTNNFALHDGTTETVIPEISFTGTPEFLFAGKYIAYKLDNQIWRYSPDKNERITVFSLSNSMSIDAVTSTGVILFTYDDKRYLSLPDKPLENIGSASGNVFVLNDRIFIRKGQTVLEVNQQ